LLKTQAAVASSFPEQLLLTNLSPYLFAGFGEGKKRGGEWGKAKRKGGAEKRKLGWREGERRNEKGKEAASVGVDSATPPHSTALRYGPGMRDT